MYVSPEMVQAIRERIARERGYVPVVLIEEDEDEMNHITVERLQELLAELEAMPELPKAGSREAVASHDEWMKTRERIRELVTRAETAALMSVPPEVADVLDAINARKCALLHLPYHRHTDAASNL